MTAHERFKSWVAEQDRDRPRWQTAAALGFSETTLSRIMSGERVPPSGQIAAKIERATADLPGGPIRSIDWWPVAEAAS